MSSQSQIKAELHAMLTRIRMEVDELDMQQSEMQDRLQNTNVMVRQLIGLTGQGHPELQEFACRLQALLQRRVAPDMQSDLAEIRNVIEKLASLPAYKVHRRNHSLTPRFKPGEIDLDHVVYYICDGSHYAVRGRLLYNIKQADLTQEYRLQSQPRRLALFPIPASLYQKYRATVRINLARGAEQYNIMVMQVFGQQTMGLIYNSIERIEAYQPGDFGQRREALATIHSLVQYRLKSGGCYYHLVGDL